MDTWRIRAVRKERVHRACGGVFEGIPSGASREAGPIDLPPRRRVADDR